MSTAQYVMAKSALTQSEHTVKITSPEKPSPNRLMLWKWQNMLDFVANLFSVGTSRITKVDQAGIDVVLTNKKAGVDVPSVGLGIGSMDEAVISHGQVLAVENSKGDRCWSEESDFPVAYLGLPIRWPDEEVFGTLAIEDTKSHVFTERYHKIMATFSEMVNTDLALLMQSDNYNKRSAYADMKVKPVKTGVCIFGPDNKIVSWNQSAEEILHYKTADVLKKPVAFFFPMVGNIEEGKEHNVMAGNNRMIPLFIEKAEMMGGDDNILSVLSFSDQSEYLQQSHASLGELHRDEQSGLYDHHSIGDLLNQEAKRALRYKQDLSIIGVRINGFKFIEEIHGEGSANLIVQTMAIILKNETRDVDCIGRLTDDLFIVGLPSTELKAAKSVADRVDRVAARYSDDATPFTVTMVVEAVSKHVDDWHAWVLELLA